MKLDLEVCGLFSDTCMRCVIKEGFHLFTECIQDVPNIFRTILNTSPDIVHHLSLFGPVHPLANNMIRAITRVVKSRITEMIRSIFTPLLVNYL